MPVLGLIYCCFRAVGTIARPSLVYGPQAIRGVVCIELPALSSSTRHSAVVDTQQRTDGRTQCGDCDLTPAICREQAAQKATEHQHVCLVGSLESGLSDADGQKRVEGKRQESGVPLPLAAALQDAEERQ